MNTAFSRNLEIQKGTCPSGQVPFIIVRVMITPLQLPVRRLILRLLCWFSMIYVWTGQHLSCNFRAFCTFCTLMSRNISQEYSFFCKIFVLFAGIFNYAIKSVFIQSLTFRVITQFGQQSGQHFARPFSLKPHHILWKGNNPKSTFCKLCLQN